MIFFICKYNFAFAVSVKGNAVALIACVAVAMRAFSREAGLLITKRGSLARRVHLETAHSNWVAVLISSLCAAECGSGQSAPSSEIMANVFLFCVQGKCTQCVYLS